MKPRKQPLPQVRRPRAAGRLRAGPAGCRRSHGAARPGDAELALVVSTVSDSVVLTDLQGRITWVNPAFERLTGYSLDEARGRTPGALLQCPSTDARTVQKLRLALAQRTGIHCEILNRAKSGRMFWIELRIQPMRSATGRLCGFLSLQVDITERRVAQQALQANRALMTRTSRIIGIGGWDFDLGTRQLNWTDQARTLLDLHAGEPLTLEALLAMCSPASRTTVERLIAAGPTPEGRWDLELEVTTPRGRAVWLRVVAQLESGLSGPVRLLGAVQDMTARHDLSEQIRRGADLLRGAIDTIDEAFAIYDPQDGLVYCNEKYKDLHPGARHLFAPGMRYEDLIRDGLSRGHYPAALGHEEEWLQRHLEARQAANRAMVKRLDDGRVLRVIDRRMPDGHRVGLRVDISDLVRATEAAELAHQAKSEFIATISHELRTPLQAILGFSDLGMHFAAGQARFEAMFKDIHGGGQRMLRLVNGLLDLSKVEGQRDALVLRSADLGPLADEVIRELAPLAAQRRVTIVRCTPMADLPVQVDAFRIQQVLRNVLANAIRFSPEGGCIEVEGRHRPGIEVELSVRDHGPGIPGDELETVFQPFVQSSRTRNGSGGTGLGLAISRRIMTAHGGRIAAHAAEGEGTVLCISLPAALPDSPGGEPAETPEAAVAGHRATTTLSALRRAARAGTADQNP